jgi:hypothetical protein
MPGKMARSTPQPPFGLPDAAGGRPHLAAVLQDGWKYANIHAGLGVIRGIPVYLPRIAPQVPPVPPRVRGEQCSGFYGSWASP